LNSAEDPECDGYQNGGDADADCLPRQVDTGILDAKVERRATSFEVPDQLKGISQEVWEQEREKAAQRMAEACLGPFEQLRSSARTNKPAPFSLPFGCVT
jgi:hypothetical protein